MHGSFTVIVPGRAERDLYLISVLPGRPFTLPSQRFQVPGVKTSPRCTMGGSRQGEMYVPRSSTASDTCRICGSPRAPGRCRPPKIKRGDKSDELFRVPSQERV